MDAVFDGPVSSNEVGELFSIGSGSGPAGDGVDDFGGRLTVARGVALDPHRLTRQGESTGKQSWWNVANPELAQFFAAMGFATDFVAWLMEVDVVEECADVGEQGGLVGLDRQQEVAPFLPTASAWVCWV